MSTPDEGFTQTTEVETQVDGDGVATEQTVTETTSLNEGDED